MSELDSSQTSRASAVLIKSAASARDQAPT
jgi:hypothetical protein